MWAHTTECSWLEKHPVYLLFCSPVMKGLVMDLSDHYSASQGVLPSERSCSQLLLGFILWFISCAKEYFLFFFFFGMHSKSTEFPVTPHAEAVDILDVACQQCAKMSVSNFYILMVSSTDEKQVH